MSSVRFPLIGGTVMRGTALDSCGRPAYGDKAQITSEGFVSIAVTANYDDGNEKVVTNANGKKCVFVPANAELSNLSLDIVFCEVDPDFYTITTGFPKIVDPVTGDAIGFTINRGVRPGDVAWALETWSNAQGSAGCDDTGAVPYGYLLWPFLSGARVGDYTIEDNAVTFSANGAVTRDGSGWAEGPYDVMLGAGGLPGPLTDPVTAMDHQKVFKTSVPPPESTSGLVPLDDPDGLASATAIAGIPGTFTPVGSRRPFDLADAALLSASPSTSWTSGQYVFLGDGSKAYWDGDSWAAGAAV